MADQSSSYPLAEQSRQARCDEVHFLGEIRGERFAVLGDGDDARSEGGDVEHIDFGQ